MIDNRLIEQAGGQNLILDLASMASFKSSSELAKPFPVDNSLNSLISAQASPPDVWGEYLQVLGRLLDETGCSSVTIVSAQEPISVEGWDVVVSFLHRRSLSVSMVTGLSSSLSQSQIEALVGIEKVIVSLDKLCSVGATLDENLLSVIKLNFRNLTASPNFRRANFQIVVSLSSDLVPVLPKLLDSVEEAGFEQLVLNRHRTEQQGLIWELPQPGFLALLKKLNSYRVNADGRKSKIEFDSGLSNLIAQKLSGVVHLPSSTNSNKIQQDTTRACLKAWTNLKINAEGNVVFCDYIRPLGGIRNISSRELSGGSYLRAIRRELLTGNLREACRDCKIAPSVQLKVFREQVGKVLKEIPATEVILEEPNNPDLEVRLATCVSLVFDLEYLPHFFRHYHSLGVSYFHLILHSNSSLTEDIDEKVEEVQELANAIGVDLTISRWIGEFGWREKVARLNEVFLTHPEAYWMSPDVDELYGIEPTGFVIRDLLERYQLPIYGMMVDRLAVSGKPEKIRNEPSLFEQFPVNFRPIAEIQGFSNSEFLKPIIWHNRLLVEPHFLLHDELRAPADLAHNSPVTVWHFKWVESTKEKLQLRADSWSQINPRGVVQAAKALSNLYTGPDELHKVLATIVCGYARGGTTVLSELLSQIPNLNSGFECGFLLTDSPSQFLDLKPFNRMLTPGWRLKPGDLEYICAANSWTEMYLRLRERARCFESSDKMKIFDKTPAYIRHLTKVIRRAPYVPVVAIVRDPRAVISSWLKRSQVPSSDWDEQFLEMQCQSYLAQTNGLTSALRTEKNARIHVVRYEELCLSFDQTAAKLFEFLDYDFSGDFKKFVKRRNISPNVYGNEFSDRYVFSYREEISKKSAEFILERTRGLVDWIWPD